MRVIYKKPGEPAEIVHIDNTLEALQGAAGGYIETVTFGRSVVVCNEEGRLQGMPYNVRICGEIFVGPIVICGVRGESFCDIPKDVEARIMPKLRRRRTASEAWDGAIKECDKR